MKSIFEYIMTFEPPSDLNYHMVEDSEYMKYIKQISKSHEELWLRDFVKLNGVDGEIKKYKSLDLYKNYKIWSKENKKSFTYEERKFYLQLKALTTQTTQGVKTDHSRDANYYIMDYDELKREGFYTYGIEEETYDDIGFDENQILNQNETNFEG
jgi:hypothetical protein